MHTLETLLWVLFSAALVHNLVVTQFLGLCPFFGTSTDVSRATGMALATSFVLVLSTSISYFIHHYFLAPYQITFLAPLVFILSIAASVQLSEIFVRHAHEGFYRTVGVFFPLITVNCAVLGVAMLSLFRFQSLFESVSYALGAALGFSLMLLSLSAIRERLLDSPAPTLVKGMPLVMITIGVVAMAFSAWSGFGDSLSSLHG